MSKSKSYLNITIINVDEFADILLSTFVLVITFQYPVIKCCNVQIN